MLRRYIRLENALADQLSSHMDTAHWCIDSLAWQETTSIVLNAILAEVGAANVEAAAEAGKKRRDTTEPLGRGKTTRVVRQRRRCAHPDRIPSDGPPPPSGW